MALQVQSLKLSPSVNVPKWMSGQYVCTTTVRVLRMVPIFLKSGKYSFSACKFKPRRLEVSTEVQNVYLFKMANKEYFNENSLFTRCQLCI